MNLDLKKLIALFAALAALVVAGCGSDDEGDSGGGDPLSEEDYATEINDILTTFGEESITLGTELSSAASPEELQSGVDDLSGLTATAVEDLNGIEPPEEAAEAHETLTGALEGYLEDIETLASAVETDDPAAAQEAALEFQEAAVDVQSELADASEQLQEAGIQAPSE
jgi:hypothetical protein